jgi:hypothetical protein
MRNDACRSHIYARVSLKRTVVVHGFLPFFHPVSDIDKDFEFFISW